MAKKPSMIWSAVKWTAAIAGGAVIGAYAVRFVDRRFGGSSSETPTGQGALGGAIGGGEASAIDMSSPMHNPLAVSAISPVMPVPVAVPQMQFSSYGYMPPTMMAPMPMPMPVQAPVPNPPPSVEVPRGPSRSELQAAARERKRREFDELVERFAEGDV